MSINHANLNYEKLKVVIDDYKYGREITKSNTIIRYLETNGFIKIKEWLNFDNERRYTEKVIPLMDVYNMKELHKILRILYDLYPEIDPEISNNSDKAANVEYGVTQV